VLEREGAPEHAESGEHGALGGGEQVVAPVEQRPQRAVARQRGAPPAREHGEHVVEPCGQLLDANVATWAAASSRASGRPSSRAQIAATCGAVCAVSAKPGCTARARSTNSSTAS
jgi:hypothetical protein